MREFNPAYVRFGSGTDITRSPSNVRFTPQSGQTADISICLLCAKSGLMHRNMVSSGGNSTEGGLVNPRGVANKPQPSVKAAFVMAITS